MTYHLTYESDVDRWFITDSKGKAREPLHCGSMIKARLTPQQTKPDVYRIEYGNGWYIVGHSDKGWAVKRRSEPPQRATTSVITCYDII